MVYFIQSLDKIKVGHTIELDRRKKELESSNPHGIVVIGTLEGNMNVEKAIHRDLDKYRIVGEWFKNCPTVRKYINKVLKGELRIRYETTRYKNENSWMDYSAETESVVKESGDVQTISIWEKYSERKFTEEMAITKEIRETQTEISMLFAKMRRLEKKYIEIVQQ